MLTNVLTLTDVTANPTLSVIMLTLIVATSTLSVKIKGYKQIKGLITLTLTVELQR